MSFSEHNILVNCPPIRITHTCKSWFVILNVAIDIRHTLSIHSPHTQTRSHIIWYRKWNNFVILFFFFFKMTLFVGVYMHQTRSNFIRLLASAIRQTTPLHNCFLCVRCADVRQWNCQICRCKAIIVHNGIHMSREKSRDTHTHTQEQRRKFTWHSTYGTNVGNVNVLAAIFVSIAH